jgi:DNA invertase Pin-like site-specific DNA recombinase
VTSERAAEKISADHLRRNAYLYVRQSTLRQVLENTTSTDRQYGLRQRAVALGWPNDQIVVIDEDLGRSGATSEGREGFQRLVADVGMGKAGIVIGLEVSRLARNNADWHRLLEICALSETLILDEDGLYDPCAFNDRLLLGLKGQMSEAELHLLKARLRGGQLSKARSGELVVPLPVGFVYDATGKVVLDPDQGVRDAIGHLFGTFARTGSARATVKAFAQDDLRFPSRVRTGPNRGRLAWLPLKHHRVLQILTTRAMPVPSPMGGASSAGSPTARRVTLSGRASRGSPSSQTPTPATSAGNSTRATWPNSPSARRPVARTAARARRARARRSYRGSSSAVVAGSG